ncbi:MAG: DUF4097 family beta strand repeat-containing protein [Chloroflexota bacterium]
MTTSSAGSGLEHAIGAEGVLSIRLRDGRIRLRAIDGETMQIRDRHDRDLAGMFAIELGEGSASFRAGHSDGRRDSTHTPDLDVALPRRATVVVEAGSAEIDAKGLVGDQRYRTASGDATLRAVSGRIAVEVVSGDVDIHATGETAVTIKTVSGDVELRAASLTALEAATTSGDLRIAGRLAGPGPFSIVTVSGDTLLAPAGDVRIEMATLSGDLRSKLGGRSESGRGRRMLEVGSGGPVVSLRSLSGDLLVVPPSLVEPPRPVAVDDQPAAPIPSAAPAAPGAMRRPEPLASNSAIETAYDEARLRILRSLEQGEIDVAEAGRRLEALDAGDDGTNAVDAVDPAIKTARFDPTAQPDA